MNEPHSHFVHDIYGAADEDHRHHDLENHRHDAGGIYGAAEEHHRHHDLEAETRSLRDDLSQAVERLAGLEDLAAELAARQSGQGSRS